MFLAIAHDGDFVLKVGTWESGGIIKFTWNNIYQ